MTYHYTKLDDGEGRDGKARYEIDETLGFTVCVVDDEETARLFCAAPQLRDTLELCEDVLSDLARLDDGTPSISALNLARAALAKARGAKSLPDPEGKNDDRAAWAGSALRHFQRATGADYEDALGDLLCDLMHWSDRNNFDFEAALFRAQGHYRAETADDCAAVKPTEG
jgi:hypothetical protein